MTKRNGKSENSEALTQIETSDEPESLAATLETLRGIAQQQLELLMPVQRIEGGTIAPHSKYNSVMHVELCRKKLMGLSNQNVARAVGISAATLINWISRYPKLAYDLEQADGLATAQAAALLRVMMHGNDPTAFHALKLYLETHAPEFQKAVKVEIEHDFKAIGEKIRGIYGVRTATAGSLAEGEETSQGPANGAPSPLDVLASSPNNVAEPAVTTPEQVDEVLSWL